ncbi:MAG: sulfotransferase [Bacteroidales bacterium]|nr:sulfotransferase [Bacteroidales bacterium]
MKRLIFLTGFIFVFSLFFIVNWTFLLLDYFLFPRFTKLHVRNPLFITGLTRTGSTLLYNALYQDRFFTSMKLWEIIFAPSITQRMIIRFLTKPAPVYEFLSHRALPFIEKHLFGGIKNIHPARFLEIEEDEFVFYQIFSSGSLFFLFPRIRHFLKYSRFDESFSEKSRKRAMRFFRRIIQRHLHFHGREKFYLSKSPSHTARIKSLRDTFHDANFIYLLREPEKVIPSTFSLFRAIRESNHVPVNDRKEFLKDGLELADHWLRHPLRIIRQSPKAKIIVIHSNDLFNKLKKVIRTIYEEFDYQFRPILYEDLEEFNMNRHKSNHTYVLEEFGLSKKILKERFSDLYNALMREKANI